MDNKFKFNMLITSFLPLWISIVIIDFWKLILYAKKIWNSKIKWILNIKLIAKNKWMCLIFMFLILFMSIFCLISLSKFVKGIEKSNNQIKKYTIILAEKDRKSSSEFLLAYIMPLIAFEFDKNLDIIIFLLYFLVLSYLCITNENIYTNIFFELKGYKMYNCTISEKIQGNSYEYKDVLVLSKIDLTSNLENDMKFYDFEKKVFINLENKNG